MLHAAPVVQNLKVHVAGRGVSFHFDALIRRAQPEGDALPGGRRMMDSGEPGRERGVARVPSGEGHAGGNVLQKDEAEIALGRSTAGDEMRTSSRFGANCH